MVRVYVAVFPRVAAMLRSAASLVCLAAVTAVTGPSAPDVSAPVASAPVSSGAVPAVRDLPFFYDLYTFRGEGGRTAVVAAFAVPVEELENEREDGRTRYRFDVSLVLSDTAVGSVTRTDDSVYVAVPRALPGRDLLHTHIQVEVRPSRSTRQRVIMTDATKPGIGQLYGGNFPIPDYRGDELMLSDVALGQPEVLGGWRRGDVTLALLPTSQFPESSFDVYYEIYNLPRGTPYTTVVTVERVDTEAGRATDPVHIRFSEESTADRDSTVAELRRVQSSLPRGRYLLTVAVTDEDRGKTVRNTRPFEVKGWDHATTLVSALPLRPKAGTR